MPSKFRLRPLFAPVVKFIAQGFHRVGMTANMATIGMLMCAGLAAGGLLVGPFFLWFAIWVFLTGIMDGVDGAIARISGKGSRFGGILDSTMDRVSEGLIYSGLLWRIPKIVAEASELQILVLVFLFLSCFFFSVMISYTRARIELVARTQEVQYDTNIGVMGRSERLLSLVILAGLTPFMGYWAILISYGLLCGAIIGTFLYRFFRYRSYLQSTA